MYYKEGVRLSERSIVSIRPGRRRLRWRVDQPSVCGVADDSLVADEIVGTVPRASMRICKIESH